MVIDQHTHLVQLVGGPRDGMVEDVPVNGQDLVHLEVVGDPGLHAWVALPVIEHVYRADPPGGTTYTYQGPRPGGSLQRGVQPHGR